MGKLSSVALGLIDELSSIRDELHSALDTIEGEGRADVIHVYHRLTDLTANVTLLAGQFNLRNLLKFLKHRPRA